MVHGDAREGKWRGNWRMEWVASTLHTTSQHVVSSLTTADAHTSAVSSRLNWRPRRFKLTRPFRRKTKSGFCACAITFQLDSNYKLSRRRIPEDLNLHQQCCGNIQSRRRSTAPFGIHIKTGKSQIKNTSRKSFAADFKHKLQLKSVEQFCRIKMGTDGRHFRPMSTFYALRAKNESNEYL
jgi:hypothetical protein